LLEWIFPRLPNELRERFLTMVVQSYEGYGQAEYLQARTKSPEIAEVSLTLKQSPFAILQHAKK
jgi:hypothetical protein